MGLLRSIKKGIVKRSMLKKKRTDVFDINSADRYELGENAEFGENNSHYFFSANNETGEVVFFRLAKRAAGASTELWFVLRDSKGDIYMQAKDHVEAADVCPSTVTCVEPGKIMTFSYRGDVVKAILNDKKQAVPDVDAKPQPIDFSGTFTGTGQPFEFSFHLAAETMANAVSKEKFTKSFQETFKKIHQVHYEQGGESDVVYALGGETVALKGLNSIRDHSFGKRFWNYFDRYIWSISMLGNHGDLVHTSMMRYPALSNLQAGFIERGETMTSLYEATPMDMLPVTGDVPDAYSVDVTYIGGEKKTFNVKKQFAVPFVFDDGFVVNEGVAEFECDGIKGLGIAEFAFNADSARWYRNKK